MTTPVSSRRSVRRSRTRSRVWARVGFGAIATVGAAGVLVAVTAAAAPDTADQAYGAAVTFTQRVVTTATETLTGTPARSAVLGREGTEADLDRCDGTFTRMLPYERTGTLSVPVWAAHNRCGGDVVLSWELGDQANITAPDGTTTAYTVTDVRVVNKTDTVTAVEGMNGELALHTCLYGQNVMKVIALTPTPDKEN